MDLRDVSSERARLEAALCRERAGLLRIEAEEKRFAARSKQIQEEGYDVEATRNVRRVKLLRESRERILRNIECFLKRIEVYDNGVKECKRKITELKTFHGALVRQVVIGRADAASLRVNSMFLRAQCDNLAIEGAAGRAMGNDRYLKLRWRLGDPTALDLLRRAEVKMNEAQTKEMDADEKEVEAVATEKNIERCLDSIVGNERGKGDLEREKFKDVSTMRGVVENASFISRQVTRCEERIQKLHDYEQECEEAVYFLEEEAEELDRLAVFMDLEALRLGRIGSGCV